MKKWKKLIATIFKKKKLKKLILVWENENWKKYPKNKILCLESWNEKMLKTFQL